MNIKEEYQKIVKLKPEGFLSSISKINNKVQFHFYNKQTNIITTYPELTQDNPYLKPGEIIEQLNIDQIKITPEQAITISEINPKIIIIIQQKQIPIYNITEITSKITNAKINAISGEIISKTIEKLF